jgi:hypothetical protein
METLIEIQLIEILSEGLLKSELLQYAALRILFAYSISLTMNTQDQR